MPNALRDLFLLDPDVIFLNHGSFGACPREVLEAAWGWQRELERNPVDFLGRRSDSLLATARAALAADVGARPDDLVFVTNATTAVNAVARSLDLRPDDEILAFDHEYGACEATWDLACRRAGARYVRVPLPLPFEPHRCVEHLLAGVTPRTRGVFLSHITSPTALILPVADLVRAARDRGLLSFVDGAHAPGHVPLDLDALGADFYTGNCHKWMCAPKGAAFLHARPTFQGCFDGNVVSWGYFPDGHDAYAGTPPFVRRHQWQGTRDPSPFLAVPTALEFQRRHGWDALRRDCHVLALQTRDRLLRRFGLPPVAPDDAVGQMVAIPLPPCDPVALQRHLYDAHRIEVPFTTHPGWRFVRVSVQAYNTEADVDALVEALAFLG